VTWNWLDIVLFAVLLFSTVRSFRRGFSREIVGLAAAVFALVLAMWFYGLVGSYVAPYTGPGALANLAGFLLVVIAVMAFGAMVAYVVNGFLRTIGLSFFDRLLGAVFGFARGVLLAIALLTAYTAFGRGPEHDAEPAAVLHSRIAPWILEASRYFVAVAPMELKVSFRKHYADIRAALEKPAKPKDSGNK
jgi:membrane protein required for colicin V production